MTAEVLQTISSGCYGVAVALFIVTMGLFFILDIRSVYGELSGRTAQKAIDEIRKKNEETGTKAYKPSKVNAERGKLTDRISDSGQIISATDNLASGIGVGTEKFPTDRLNPAGNETTVLQSQETTVLNGTEQETTVLVQQRQETTVLTAAQQETTVLISNQGLPQQLPEQNDVPLQNGSATQPFTVDVDLCYTGSEEMIE